jgi:hypothetical protein
LFHGTLFSSEIGGDHHPDVPERALIHPAAVVFDLNPCARWAVRVLQSHSAASCICVIGILDKLKNGEIGVTDELVAKESQKPWLDSEN